MIHLNQTIEILTGGSYTGNSSWNKKYSEIDNCFKIYYLTNGELYLRDENQEYLLEQKGVYFINGNKLTYQYCKNSFSTYWLHFIPKDLVVYQGLLALPLVVDFPAKIRELHEPMKNIDILISRGLTSYKDYYLESLRIQTFLQTLVINLLERYPWGNPEQAGNIERIEPAIQYINTCFTEQIRLEQLAELCCMSPNYFHKIFSNTLQTTPANYISLLRMNTALQLLTGNNSTIKEVAYKLGFNDDAYFSRAFKKQYGITPGEYKKKRNDFLF